MHETDWKLKQPTPARQSEGLGVGAGMRVIRACCRSPQGEQIGSKTLIDIIFKRAFYVQEAKRCGTEHGTSDVQVSHIHYVY